MSIRVRVAPMLGHYADPAQLERALDRYALVLVCDNCGQPITDAAGWIIWNGSDAWEETGAEPSTVHPYCVHEFLLDHFPGRGGQDDARTRTLTELPGALAAVLHLKPGAPWPVPERRAGRPPRQSARRKSSRRR